MLSEIPVILSTSVKVNLACRLCNPLFLAELGTVSRPYDDPTYHSINHSRQSILAQAMRHCYTDVFAFRVIRHFQGNEARDRIKRRTREHMERT